MMLKRPDAGTCRGKDALKLQSICRDGDVFIRDAAAKLGRSVAYTRSVAEEFGFEVVRFPGLVRGWLIGWAAAAAESEK